jgi:hypothetical protein
MKRVGIEKGLGFKSIEEQKSRSDWQHGLSNYSNKGPPFFSDINEYPGIWCLSTISRNHWVLRIECSMIIDRANKLSGPNPFVFRSSTTQAIVSANWTIIQYP